MARSRFPLVGEVDARGKTVADLNKLVAERLTKYISGAVVTISVQEIKGNKIFVLGQVNKPGEFIVNPSVNIMQALSMAGGMTPFAATNDIIVLRGQGKEQTAMAFRYPRSGARPPARNQHRADRRRHRCCAVTPALITPHPGWRCPWHWRRCSASAANWEIAPRVEAGYRYSDNYHLGPPGDGNRSVGRRGRRGR